MFIICVFVMWLIHVPRDNRDAIIHMFVVWLCVHTDDQDVYYMYICLCEKNVQEKKFSVCVCVCVFMLKCVCVYGCVCVCLHGCACMHMCMYARMCV